MQAVYGPWCAGSVMDSGSYGWRLTAVGDGAALTVVDAGYADEPLRLSAQVGPGEDSG
ncbi:hypothetical protein STTU_0327 [Streptomyces sp. Tu6071]|nr:hypothetical protein STTU_0327 [Streptomyces sp. Tu6071]